MYYLSILWLFCQLSCTVFSSSFNQSTEHDDRKRTLHSRRIDTYAMHPRRIDNYQPPLMGCQSPYKSRLISGLRTPSIPRTYHATQNKDQRTSPFAAQSRVSPSVLNRPLSVQIPMKSWEQGHFGLQCAD